MSETMRIDAKPGTKIRYAYPNNGYESQQNAASVTLVVGQVYTVERIAVHSWSTTVYLVEKPGLPFNSVLFADLEDGNGALEQKVFDDFTVGPNLENVDLRNTLSPGMLETVHAITESAGHVFIDAKTVEEWKCFRAKV